MAQELVRRNEVIVHDNRDELAMMLRVQHQRGRLLCPPEQVFYRQRADSSWWVKVPMLLPPKATPKAKQERPSRRRREIDDGLAAIGKALVWIAGLMVLAGIGLFVLVKVIMGALADVDWPTVAGTALLVMVIVAILTRLSGGGGHSGGYGFHWTKCK